jgi:ATP-binding cassette, subfamily C (CFTR/MRP), member 1
LGHFLLNVQITTTSLAIQSLTLVVLYAVIDQTSLTLTRMTLAGAVLQFLEAVFLIAESLYEHRYNPQSSIALNIYLSITLICQSVCVRTLWLARSEMAICVLTSTSVLSRAILLVLESLSKRPLLKNVVSMTPENGASFPATIFFGWLLTLLISG